MRELEAEADAFLQPMMNGEPVVLEKEAQHILAAWICLVPMVDELRDPAGAAIPDTDREWLRLHKEPPPNWRIWLAKYGGKNWDTHRLYRMGMHVTTPSTPPVDDHRVNCNTQVTTFVIRQFCAHAFSSTVWPDFQGYDGLNVEQIWPDPSAQFEWANASVITDRLVISLSESLARSLPTLR